MPGVQSCEADIKTMTATVKATKEFDTAKGVEAIVEADARFSKASVLE